MYQSYLFNKQVPLDPLFLLSILLLFSLYSKNLPMHEHYELLSQQIYARAWLDNTFKYILSHERVRNRFLSLVLGVDIQSSTLDHTSLNPVRDNDKTYLWLSKSSSQSFERDWLDLIKKHAPHKEHKMAELLFHLQELKQYYPKPQ